jgi:hypothetical protein
MKRALPFVLMFVCLSGCRSLHETLSKYAFTELEPPSTLVPPGTLVSVVQENPLVAGVICTSVDDLGSKLSSRLLTSDSAQSKEAKDLTGSFELDATYVDRVSGHVSGSRVRSVTVELSNVKVVELPDSAVFELVSDRSSPCKSAVAFRRGRGERVSMIKAVLSGDATYRVVFSSSVEASAKAKITKEIAASFGLKVGSNSDDSFGGTNLIWGVRDDQALATVSATQPPPTGARAPTRALPSGQTARVVILEH